MALSTKAAAAYLTMADHMRESKCSLKGFGRNACSNRNISHCSQAVGSSLQSMRIHAEDCSNPADLHVIWLWARY